MVAAMFDMAANPDTSLMQSHDFADALRLCGQDPVILPDGALVLHRRVMGVSVVMLPRATPGAALSDHLRQVGLHRVPLILSPETFTRKHGLRLRKPARAAQIDLRIPQSIRFAGLHQKWRNQLRHAQNSDLTVVRAPMLPDATLPDLDAAQGQKQGYRNWPVGLTRAFAQVAPKKCQVFTAKLKGQTVAQMLFLLHGTTRATYHIGHTTTLGRLHHAHNLILWTAQNWLSDRGIGRLDLGLLDPKTPNLNRFKLRSGAHAFNLGGTWLRWSPLARHDVA